MKILIVRFSSIGDIILCTPVIRACKEQLGAEVHFLTKKSFGGLLGNNPHLSKIHTFKEHLKEIRATLKAEKYDFVVDLHKNLRSFQVKNWLDVSSKSFPKVNLEKWLYVNAKINRLPKLHIVDRYFQACPEGVTNDGRGLDYYIRPENRVEVNVKNFVCLILGATYFTKRIPIEILSHIISGINGQVILIGGSEEKKIGLELEAKYDHASSACGIYNIDQSASIIDQSKYVIASDTGMMHISAALKKPIGMVWGNTVPDFGMGPYETEVNHFQVVGLSCRPCSKLGKDACPKGHFRCMLDQDVKRILSHANSRLIA